MECADSQYAKLEVNQDRNIEQKKQLLFTVATSLDLASVDLKITHNRAHGLVSGDTIWIYCKFSDFWTEYLYILHIMY